MTLQFKTKSDAKTKNILLPYFQDDVDYQQIKSISGVDVSDDFNGKRRSSLLIFSKDGKHKYHLLGLGKFEKQKSQAADVFRHYVYNRKENFPKVLAVDLQHLSAEVAYDAARGIRLSSYLPNDLKSEKGEQTTLNKLRIQIIHADKAAKQYASEGLQTAETQMAVMHLVNSPANVKTPKYIAAYAKKSGKKNGFKVSVLNKAQLKKQGLHALLAVGQGSVNEPVFIKMEYKPASKKNSKKPQLGLVGKGITFDTGGISIKGEYRFCYLVLV